MKSYKKLSNVYDNKVSYALVYHVSKLPNSQVEFITEKFFPSKKKALKWYYHRYTARSFLSPEVVKVSFNNLKLIKP